MPSSRTNAHLRLHCVNVYVRNQERSLRFYLDQLGFQGSAPASRSNSSTSA